MSKYVPDLLPNQPRFDIDSGVISDEKNNKSKSKVFQLFLYILAIIFFAFSLVFIFTRFWQGVLFLTIGLVLLPNVHNWIEKTLRFKFNILPRIIFIVILLVLTIILDNSYEKKEKQIAENKRIAEENERLAKEEAERIEKVRVDSLLMLHNSAIKQINENKLEEAYNSIQIALMLSETDEEKNKSNSINADYLVKSGKYLEAIELFTVLIHNRYNLSDVYYKRALCYQKTNKIQETVDDLKQSINLGNGEADKLHEKINPIRRKIVGYVTLCCDGTTSDSRGRGACSQHGGVCDWNHPIYEEYRKY